MKGLNKIKSTALSEILNVVFEGLKGWFELIA
jgi:hypothetical protein